MTRLGSVNEVDEKISEFNTSPGGPVFAEVRTFHGNMSYDIAEVEYWSSKICLFVPDPDVARDVRRLDEAWCHFLYLQASNGELVGHPEQVTPGCTTQDLQKRNGEVEHSSGSESCGRQQGD